MKNINIEGHLNGKDKKFSIILSRFNSFITERLLEGAVDCLIRHDVDEADITVIRVPGAWEIPVAVKRISEKSGSHGIICLGAVIRGETPHFDYVAAEVSKGIAAISLETGKPIGFGILTTDNVDQAVNRAGTKSGNKGWETALTVLEMTDVLERIERI